MTIAILSDVHDNIWNLEAALRLSSERACNAMAFLGDFCAPFTLAQLAEGFSGPLHAVFGNNDGDQFALTTKAAQYQHVTLHGLVAELVFDGVSIGLTHYPQIATHMCAGGAFQAVFSGHDHRPAVTRCGPTLWANPGEVMGRFGAPSFGVYDTDEGTFEHVPIRG